MQSAREVYSSIPNDSILKGFRRESGLPAPGEDLRGWCKTRTRGDLRPAPERHGAHGPRDRRSLAVGQGRSAARRVARDVAGGRQLAHAALRLGEARVRPGRSASIRRHDDGVAHPRADHRHGPPERSTARDAIRTISTSGARARDRRRSGTRCPKISIARTSRRAIGIYKDFGDVWLYDDYWRPLAGRDRNCRRSFRSMPTATRTRFQRRDGVRGDR